jgi:hypothetical protein
MALAIAWRNPTPMHIRKRCIRFGKGIRSDIYLVQELMIAAEEQRWADMSVLEVLCSRHVEVHCVLDDAVNESRAAGAKVTSQQQADETRNCLLDVRGLGPSCSFVGRYCFAPSEVHVLMAAVKTASPQPIQIKSWKAQDWIDHASFGIGQVSESRGDKLDIDFVEGGRRTLLKSTELNRAVAPGGGFKFPRNKSKPRNGQLKVKGPPKGH